MRLGFRPFIIGVLVLGLIGVSTAGRTFAEQDDAVTKHPPAHVEPNTAPARPAPPPDVSAKAAALIDVDSGRILYEKNAHEKLPIASLTKIMTAIVAIEAADLDEVVTVSPRAVGIEGSSIYLRQGERMTLRDLLYGLMLRSGNDAALAVAEHVGGSVESFVAMMNEKAAWLGLMETHWTNPHGLDDPDHYSSAYDLVRLSAYALHNPTFRRIVSTQKWTAPLPGAAWDRLWLNKNRLLSLYPYADGIKTGYTKQTGRALAASATRDGRRLAAVVLNDGDDWNDSIRLLDYGFDVFQPVEFASPDQPIIAWRDDRPVRLYPCRRFIYPLRSEEIDRIESAVVWQDQKSGGAPAFVVFMLDGRPIARLPLYERPPEEMRPSSAAMDRPSGRCMPSSADGDHAAGQSVAQPDDARYAHAQNVFRLFWSLLLAPTEKGAATE
ncbi:MAG: D-alanyl-D-alanine carboxypeptidase [Hydrogenibacillus sp.]|nr:D-alanyl-D-alanine carboxypeptidase [Hydrogenibacillus sp.]